MAQQCLCYPLPAGASWGGRRESGMETFWGRGDPLISASPNCRVLLSVLNRADTPSGECARSRRVACRALGAPLCADWGAQRRSGELAATRARAARPCRPPARVGVSRGCKPTRNRRGDLTARFAVGPRTQVEPRSHASH